MQAESNYFAYCLDTNTRLNYFIVPSDYLNPRPKARHSNPGVAWDTLGQEFWGAVLQSAWHGSLEVDPDDGSFLDQSHKTDKDFEDLLTEAEWKECLVLATASSVQELQVFVQTCNIKVPKKSKRLGFSNASGSQQHDQPHQQNVQFGSSESYQRTKNKDFSAPSKCLEEPNSTAKNVPTGVTPFVLSSEDKDIVMEGPIESHDVSENDERDDSHIRPEGVANLGFFESEIDGRVTTQNADNVCVLVIHYEFKNNRDYFRKGDACDVENLKTSFGKNRNCNFRNLSPNKETLLQLLGNQEKLLQFFNTQDEVPSVFMLFILSHGSENGKIWTDHVKSETNEREYFTTDEILDSLQKLQRFDKCLKVVNFGSCRGSLDDSKFDLKKSYKDYENKNSCRISTRPGMHNYIVFYSTVETTLANTDKNGSWFVRNICSRLNEANHESLLKFFTIVQNRMHQTSRTFTTFEKNTPLGQTPELKMFQQDRKFIISKAKIRAQPISNHDSLKGNLSKVSNERMTANFSWKSDEEHNIRGRKCFILSVVQGKQVQEVKRVLRKLDFEIRDWILSRPSMDFYFRMVSELEPDVGCILTCIFGPVCENQEKEVCVRVQKGQDVPISDILRSLVGPKNDKLIGKPKILFVVNVEAPQTDNITVPMKDLQVSATNHSGWLVLILKYEDASEKLIELLGNIDEKTSLQELLEPLLTRESKREELVFLNSTLQYLINFPTWPRIFVKPDFKLKMTNNSRGQMFRIVNSMESPYEKKIDFDTLVKEAKRLFEENKKPKVSPLKTMSGVENPKILSNNESSIQSLPVKNIESTSTTSDSTEESIFWLFNSVAGAGKSTVIVEMAHQLTQFGEGFKILLIPLKKYYRYLFDMPAKNVNEIEFLAKTTFNFHDDINNWIMKREVIVFIDGFDEVCPDFREKIINILISINNAGVPIFVGTRPHEVHHIQERIQNTTIVEIEPLDEAKQIDFLRIVAQKNEQDINQLRENFKDKDILGNPLYLNLLANYNGDGNLYEIFDTMVRRKVEICLKRENGDKDVGDETIEKSLKFIQLVASRFVTGVKIDQGSVTKEELEKINAFGVVTYFNEQVNFTHQTFAEFLTAQKFLYDLKNPGAEEVPLFNEELVQCRKFVDLFFSTEKGKDATYAEALMDRAKISDPVKLLKQICGENLSQMFRLLNPDLSLKDEDGKNALHFALRHLEMVKKVHEKKSKLAIETTKNGENCLHLAIDDNKCSEEVAIWLLENTEVDKNAKTIFVCTPILCAGLTQKWEVARQLLLYNIEINQIDCYGKSILHYAVCSNDIVLVQELLGRGSIVNLQDDEGNTDLHLAAMSNKNADIVKILLEKSAKVNAQNNDKSTALHLAARNNPASEIFQMLLENGADIHSQTQYGFTALHLAAGWNRNPELVKILLQRGAKVNAQNNKNWTALHLAARYNPASEIFQMLLENGTDIHSQIEDGSTALHLAARWNKNPELVKILLESGAKVNAQDDDKWTALHYAARYNRASKIVQMLLENGAEINSQTEYGSTALHLAARWNEKPELVKILLENGAKVNAGNNDKETALHLAARFNPASEIVQMLLENGAEINSQTQYGSTALHLAAGWNENHVLVQTLLEKGAKVNAQNNGKWTALHYAARYNSSPEVVQKLLDKGVEINVENSDGETPLFLAAKRNRAREVVQILLDHGAEVNEKTRNDKKCVVL